MFDFDDWGEYGIDSLLYEKSQKRINELQDVINSGNFFDTDWHKFSNCPYTMRICRTPENITIYVGSSMERFRKIPPEVEQELDVLTDEKLEKIRTILSEIGFEENVVISLKVDINCSAKDIINKAVTLSINCDNRIYENYQKYQKTVCSVLYNDLN